MLMLIHSLEYLVVYSTVPATSIIHYLIPNSIG